MPRVKKTETEAKEAKKVVKKEENVTPEIVKESTLSVDIYDLKGSVIGKITLPQEIFGEKVNKSLITQAVRVYLANQRRGTASTKTRGEVRGSTRKIYKQKGTGRARHGGVRAPIFVHGGIAFGPKPRDYSLELPKRMKKKALFSALSQKLKDGEIKVISGLLKIEPKTKNMVKVLQALKLNDKKRQLALVVPQDVKKELVNVQRAARNMEGVVVTKANQLNTYEVLKNKELLFMQEAIESMKNNL